MNNIMKKMLVVFFSAAMILSLVACSGGSKEETFTGEAEGYGGTITAKVTVKDGKIVGLELTGDKETPTIGGQALEPLKEAILKAGTVDGVDAYSGATWTSNGVFEAVRNALGSGSTGGKTDDPTATTASGVKAGLAIVTTPRLGPGKDDKEVPVYSFNEVVAYVVLDGDNKIVDLEVDILEIITPNHDGAEDNVFAGWPGQTYNNDSDADGVVDGELTFTNDDFVSTVSAYRSKRTLGNAYKMNSGTWESEMDTYESFFIGKTVDEIKAWFATSCSDLNGRPLHGKSEKDADVAKRDAMTDEQKAELDTISGATMSLSDAHGDILGAIETAANNAKPVATTGTITGLGLGIVTTPRLGPGKDDKDVPVYSFNVVATGALYGADGKIMDMESDILEIITPNHDGAEDNVFAGWPGQTYNNDSDADGVVDGELTFTNDDFVSTLSAYRSKRTLGSAYKMNSGTWTSEMDTFEGFFTGKTVEEIEAWAATSLSDLNGRPLHGKSEKDADVAKRDAMTDEQKAELDTISGATMSLTDAHGNLLASLKESYTAKKAVNITVK